MSIGLIRDEGDLQRWLDKQLLERHGLMNIGRLEGNLEGRRVIPPLALKFLAEDPDPPEEQEALLYGIADNGSAQKELRVIEQDGTITTIGAPW